MKNVEQRRTKGAITHEDIMRAERLKNDLFPDYEFLNRLLGAQKKALQRNAQPPNIGALLKQVEEAKSKEKLYADNAIIPMSYSGVTDPQPIIFNKARNLASKNPKNFMLERFENPYYELCREKLTSVDKKREKQEAERIRQQEKVNEPS